MVTYARLGGLQTKGKAMTNPNEVTDAEAQEVLRQLGREYSHSVIGDCKRAINRILQSRSATSDAARSAMTLALAHIRWKQFGECRTVNHDGPPPTAAEADAALVAAIAAGGSQNG